MPALFIGVCLPDLFQGLFQGLWEEKPLARKNLLQNPIPALHLFTKFCLQVFQGGRSRFGFRVWLGFCFGFCFGV